MNPAHCGTACPCTCHLFKKRCMLCSNLPLPSLTTTAVRRHLERRIKDTQEQLDHLHDRLATIDQLGEDDFEVGTVLTWQQNYGTNKGYTYVAVKFRDNAWRASNGDTYNWDQLVEQHLSKTLDGTWAATGWEEVTSTDE